MTDRDPVDDVRELFGWLTARLKKVGRLVDADRMSRDQQVAALTSLKHAADETSNPRLGNAVRGLEVARALRQVFRALVDGHEPQEPRYELTRALAAVAEDILIKYLDSRTAGNGARMYELINEGYLALFGQGGDERRGLREILEDLRCVTSTTAR